MTHLVVGAAGDGAPLGFGRAWLRNLLKLGLPWVLSHVGVTAALKDAPNPPSWAPSFYLLGLAVGVLWAAGLFVGSGRTIYDWISGTRVDENPVPRP